MALSPLTPSSPLPLRMTPTDPRAVLGRGRFEQRIDRRTGEVLLGAMIEIEAIALHTHVLIAWRDVNPRELEFFAARRLRYHVRRAKTPARREAGSRWRTGSGEPPPK